MHTYLFNVFPLQVLHHPKNVSFLFITKQKKSGNLIHDSDADNTRQTNKPTSQQMDANK